MKVLISGGQTIRVFWSNDYTFRNFSVMIKRASVRYFSTSRSLIRYARNFFRQHVQVRTIIVRGVCVIRARPFWTLIGTNGRMLTTTPISVEPQPRIGANFKASSRFVTMKEGFFPGSLPRVFLHATQLQSVIIYRVGVYSPIIGYHGTRLSRVFVRANVSRVIPRTRECFQRRRSTITTTIMFRNFMA